MSAGTADIRARTVAEAERLFDRWYPGERLEVECGAARREAGAPPALETPVAAWRTVEAELRLGVDPASGAVVWFEDPEGRAGAPPGAVQVTAERADEIVDGACVLMVGARLVSAKLEPARPGAGVLWRLEYGRGGPVSIRVEVHPVTGAIVGFHRLGHPLVVAREAAP